MPPLAVSYSGLLGGAEHVLVDVAAGLPEPPLLACAPGPLAARARARGLAVFELRERSLELRHSVRTRLAASAHMAAQATELRRLAATTGPDALIAWGMRAGLALAAAFPRRGGPPLLFQHNDLLPGPLIARAVRAAAGRADVTVAASRCVAHDLDPRGALGGRLRVIYPGVDLERFRPRGEARRRPPEVLVLGAVEPWKRPDVALEAVALAARELPELRLRLAGQPIGAEGRRLLELLRERVDAPDLRDRVILAGPTDQPEEALAGASCLLHCADREPFGIAVVEALACGLPVVAPNSCGPAESVPPGCGRLYRAGDPAGAASALVDVLSDPRAAARMGARARLAAEQRFGRDRMAEQYAQLLEELAAGARPAAAVRVGERPLGSGLTVLTVLHNSESQLATLLGSLERHLPGAAVVVVDSGSSDAGVEVARGWRDGAAAVIELGENVGFGRGVNAGMALVETPVTALLNPDVELPDASLAAAAREALRAPERLIAPLVLRPGGAREDSAHREPGSAALLAHALLPGAGLPQSVAAVIEPWRAARPRRVGWAVGSCLVARTETLRRLGPFDERAFMYAEDLDLGLRAADAGIQTCFWPGARVIHSGAHSSRRSFGGEPLELLARRRREVVAERRGRRRAGADDLLQALTFLDRMALKRLIRREAQRERRQLKALLRARRS